ncbi:hypothetical protein BJ742DRAFT_825021 [Cladochytrium replicatum]|nr:hypothetical protein BJ742DRAFT_825021 [Cladochytrium replicatum]
MTVAANLSLQSDAAVKLQQPFDPRVPLSAKLILKKHNPARNSHKEDSPAKKTPSPVAAASVPVVPVADTPVQTEEDHAVPTTPLNHTLAEYPEHLSYQEAYPADIQSAANSEVSPVHNHIHHQHYHQPEFVPYFPNYAPGPPNAGPYPQPPFYVHPNPEFAPPLEYPVVASNYRRFPPNAADYGSPELAHFAPPPQPLFFPYPSFHQPAPTELQEHLSNEESVEFVADPQSQPLHQGVDYSEHFEQQELDHSGPSDFSDHQQYHNPLGSSDTLSDRSLSYPLSDRSMSHPTFSTASPALSQLPFSPFPTPPPFEHPNQMMVGTPPPHPGFPSWLYHPNAYHPPPPPEFGQHPGMMIPMHGYEAQPSQLQNEAPLFTLPPILTRRVTLKDPNTGEVVAVFTNGAVVRT